MIVATRGHRSSPRYPRSDLCVLLYMSHCLFDRLERFAGCRSITCRLCAYSGRRDQILLPRPNCSPHFKRRSVRRFNPSFSPLHTTLHSSPEKVEPELNLLLSRLHVLIIGPGLGREPYMQSFARLALSLARTRGMFLVIDADALWMIGQDLSLIKGYRRAVLTPNVVEFKRLSEQVGLDSNTPAEKRADFVSQALGGVTVLQKGSRDIIAINTSGDAADLRASQLEGIDEAKESIQESFEIDTPGGLKRCGGQGDVLSGCVGTFLAWGKCYETGAFGCVLQCGVVQHFLMYTVTSQYQHLAFPS